MSFLSYETQKSLFSFVESLPLLARWVNGWAINRVVNRARARPHPLSTRHDYVCWPGLTDKQWSGRHLAPRPRATAPTPDDLVSLFARENGKQRLCPKSTCLFPAFAQYLTDGFIRTESEHLTPAGETQEKRLQRNTSNHEIDLCPLYGRTPAQTDALRVKSEEFGSKGRLKSQTIKGEEYAPFLYKKGRVDPQFKVLDVPLGASEATKEIRASLFAFGGDRANSVPQVAMLNTVFLREHNRLAAVIEEQNPKWDDNRVFETARNTVIVIFIKIIVEDYINHISPMPFNLRADPSVAWNAPWNKPNWITTEFSLLYRWHALIPDTIKWGGEDVPVHKTFLNNALLLENGLLEGFAGLCKTQAGELGPHNTAEALLHIEKASIEQDRFCNLASFSDYCYYMSQPRPETFDEISSDPKIASKLAKLYEHPRDVDFHVGLFCQDRVANSPLPNLVLVFVALDAFSQALTNPLLSEHVFKKSTFSGVGWSTIHETQRLKDVLARNVEGGLGDTFISMTRAEWSPE
ncbi:MAG: peroxidase family protein [Roseobacter sp.]